MRIQHNIPALNTYKNLSATDRGLAKDLEKLSSGYKINRAGDDAAGLAISEKMRSQMTGLAQAGKNAEDGVSLVQTAEGAMTEVHSMLNRMVSLAVQSANGTYAQGERKMMNDELTRLKTEIDRIGAYSNFNGTKLFKKSNEGESPNRIASYDLTLDLTNLTVHVNSAKMFGNTATGFPTAPVGKNAALAEKIATEYFPNAITQILDAFPSLKTAVGQDTIDMKLQIDYIDGSSGTLAYAQYSYRPAGKPINMLIKVDSADFSDSSIESGSPAVEVLESTIAHELMHSVMQYTMTDGMSGRNGTAAFPDWFTEGTAQLAGGGFPTNWNNSLEAIAKQLGSATDSSQDTAITDYLKAYSPSSRPYGHGYLASAYLGYLASGQTDVTGANIASGMDKIFANILNGKSLYDAISTATGRTFNGQADIEALFSAPAQDVIDFIRQLSYASKGGGNDGAGSVIAASLAAGADNIIGNTVTGPQAFRVTEYQIALSQGTVVNSLQLMVGSEGADSDLIGIDLFQMDSDAIGLTDADILTAENARNAIDTINTAIDEISSIRSYYGAIQNRLEHTINNLGNTLENITAAESRIRDTDMAKAVMNFTRSQILLQSGQSMLAQANMLPQAVLQLLN